MRLLEFSRDNGGANPQQHTPEPTLHAEDPLRTPSSRPSNKARRVFPIEGNAVRKPAERPNIDIEQLRERIEILEQRMQERARNEGTPVASRDIETLKQRMKLLERNINSELWAAKQREHTMLEILARQPLKIRIKQRLARIPTHDLPAIGRWLKAVAVEWWQDTQPGWWQGLANAWRESLDKARGLPPSS